MFLRRSCVFRLDSIWNKMNGNKKGTQLLFLFLWGWYRTNFPPPGYAPVCSQRQERCGLTRCVTLLQVPSIGRKGGCRLESKSGLLRIVKPHLVPWRWGSSWHSSTVEANLGRGSADVTPEGASIPHYDIQSFNTINEYISIVKLMSYMYLFKSLASSLFVETMITSQAPPTPLSIYLSISLTLSSLWQ